MPDKPSKSKAVELDTRRTPRRVFTRPIGILHAGKYDVVQALELSEGGVTFAGPEGMTERAQVVVSLCLPGGGVIVARGEVSGVRAEKGKPAQHTLKFLPLSLQLRRMIRNYVTAKTQAEAETEAKRESDGGTGGVSGGVSGGHQAA